MGMREARMTTIHATYSNGVFRPKEPVDLPENTPVEFEPRILKEKTQDGVYGILQRRFRSGTLDTAQRHDEHQP
jgi:predicted DNA-binding antitoxin AbrB/MazE fold protein